MHTHLLLPPLQVKRLVCKECGKACRSDEEWDLHSKRTGHAAYDDRVSRALCWVDLCVVLAFCKPQAPRWLVQTNEGEAVDTEAQMKAARAEEAGGSGEGQGGGSDEPVELVPAEVDGELLKQMEEMVGGPCCALCTL